MGYERADLQPILQAIIGPRQDKKPNVYFQPPSTIILNYPCIIYKRDDKTENFAGNVLYLGKFRYQITIIDQNPDSSIPAKISKLPFTSFVRHFSADSLNHDVYATYF